MKTKLFIFLLSILFLSGCAKTMPQADNTQRQDQISDDQAKSQMENRLVALGSSLTRASNLSSKKQGENNEYSFSTGTKIDSLYLYLKKQYPGLSATNLASPGAQMNDVLERQLPDALKKKPKFITLDPGAEVVNQNPSVSRFAKDLSQIIESIDPQTTIFLFTYPNFTKMRTANFSSCKENKVGVSLENLSESNIEKFNQAIKETVAGKNNVILVDIFNLLGPDDISDYDCLHLNIKGQEKIAQQFINSFKNKDI